ncbi:3-mercaptopyruvate sulfurtransferase [Maritalea porphyrae]|uniref:3-mercaptopyruvate sulfurtransferase n=1 Tax=Maritalea porphyrae TaxID=880732 RepID=UPI0022AE6417|nr:3-mercaptopyruvate sulfurtransferase [Maritalea porphyrae]MCZ4273530.1 3-mercaptopyruvate sulfurtransferase [Maritalea porphyrae]
MSNRPILIRANELHAKLNDPNLAIVDGSWHLPNANRDPFFEYTSGHIEGAHFFDIDEIADRSSGLPHTLPTNEHFANCVGAMGISNSDEIVVYDAAGMFSAARVWWMLKSYGAQNVRVLDGGLPAWKSAGFAVTDKKPSPNRVEFVAQLNKDQTVPLPQMREFVKAGESQILDARGAGRFFGQEAEPRAGTRSGHMPGATNVPFSTLLNDDGTFKSNEELSVLFSNQGLDLSAPTIATCGSGVTAAIILLALELIGKTDARLYDGSWAEWGSLSDTPVEID